MFVRKNSLYASLPLPSISTELPPSPCAEKVSAFSDCHIYEYDSSEFQIIGMVLPRQRLHLCSLLRGGVIFQTRLRIDDIFLSHRFFFLVAKMIFA